MLPHHCILVPSQHILSGASRLNCILRVHGGEKRSSAREQQGVVATHGRMCEAAAKASHPDYKVSHQ